MKKILVYVTTDLRSSLFDLIVAYDLGVDVVVPYSNIEEHEVEEIIHNCVFTRHSKKLNNTAVFFGGKDATTAEGYFEESKKVLDTLPGGLRVSICLDAEGASTTSSACVRKVREGLGGKLEGVKVTVLAGTGPVGQRIAVLLSREGASVKLSSRREDRAANVCRVLEGSYGVKIRPCEVKDGKTLSEAIADADAVVSCGSEGVEILPESVWRKNDSIRVFVDLNAVPPYGIGGIKPTDDLVERENRVFVGAFSVGNLKMKLHSMLISKLFERNDGVYGLYEIYSMME